MCSLFSVALQLQCHTSSGRPSQTNSLLSKGETQNARLTPREVLVEVLVERFSPLAGQRHTPCRSQRPQSRRCGGARNFREGRVKTATYSHTLPSLCIDANYV